APPEEEIDDTITEHGETTVSVVNRRATSVGATGATTVQTTAPDGASVRVDIPAGSLEGDPSGLRLEVAAVRRQSQLDQQAPPLGGADVFASFVVRLVDLRGNTVDASFTHPVTLTFTIPASALPEDA